MVPLCGLGSSWTGVDELPVTSLSFVTSMLVVLELVDKTCSCLMSLVREDVLDLAEGGSRLISRRLLVVVCWSAVAMVISGTSPLDMMNYSL